MAKKNIDLEQVTLELDDHSEITCDVIAIFPVKVDNDTTRDYIALLDENAEEDDDIMLYRCDVSNLDDIKIDSIESDEEFDIVADAFDELLDEAEFAELTGAMDDDEE
ncbi:MAG: DUF1292 domain-containing protein [Lachnospiraceae bacterium]|nr:DUF1292 domain-containing protein [Lachnospiraceae bacterium]